MDVFSRKKRSAVMSGIRSRNNLSTEQKFIGFLRASKITGWRRNFKLMGKPDFVFLIPRIVVFIDGCFWHKCPYCYDGHVPRQNKKYWNAKLNNNLKRDRRVNDNLRRLGWRVFRIRECSLSKRRPTLFACLAVLARTC
jgi:DNA mismatch endonuclease (patch repair protein)